jgi:hypothetical protein
MLIITAPHPDHHASTKKNQVLGNFVKINAPMDKTNTKIPIGKLMIKKSCKGTPFLKLSAMLSPFMSKPSDQYCQKNIKNTRGHF